MYFTFGVPIPGLRVVEDPEAIITLVHQLNYCSLSSCILYPQTLFPEHLNPRKLFPDQLYPVSCIMNPGVHTSQVQNCHLQRSQVQSP